MPRTTSTISSDKAYHDGLSRRPITVKVPPVHRGGLRIEERVHHGGHIHCVVERVAVAHASRSHGVPTALQVNNKIGTQFRVAPLPSIDLAQYGFGSGNSDVSFWTRNIPSPHVWSGREE